MPLVLADRVRVRSRTQGNGDFTLEQTVDGFQSFEVVGDGNETYYGIIDNVGNWEIGRGTYYNDSTVEVLRRDSVISSSNSNNLVNFPVGSKNVFVTFPSSLATSLIADAASDSFKNISVSGQSDVVADSPTDTLTFEAGTGITITTNPSTDTVTITNSAAATPSIGVNDLTDATITSPTNGQVLKYSSGQWINSTDTDTNTTYQLTAETTTGGAFVRLTGSDTAINNVKLAAGANMTITRTDSSTITLESTGAGGSASDSFKTIAISGQSDVVADSATDTLNLVAGTGISLTTNATTDSITITNTQATANAFGTIAISGQTNVVADNVSDILTLVAGAGISLTTNATTDTVTIANTGIGTTYSVSAETATGGAALRLTGSDASTDNVNFVAGTNVTVTRTDANTIVIASTASGGSASSRTTASVATGSITDGTTTNATITGYKGYALFKIYVSAAAWVRIYSDTASRTADASRSELTDPDPGSGVIAEVITTGAETILLTPAAIGFSNEGTPTADIPIAITNKSGTTRAFTVTLTLLQLEA